MKNLPRLWELGPVSVLVMERDYSTIPPSTISVKKLPMLWELGLVSVLVMDYSTIPPPLSP